VTRVLLIADIKGGVFLTMPKVLEALPAEASGLHWHILDIGAVLADDASGLNVLEMEERVLASPTGLPLSFVELTKFARSTRQVIDGVFVAIDSTTRPPARTDDDAAIVEQSVAVVAAFDSTFWLVAAPDAWLEHAARTFTDVRWENVGDTPLRASDAPDD